MKRKIKLGLYGCGNRTRALLDALFFDGEYRVAAAYDLRPEAVAAVHEKHGGDICASSRQLVQHPGVEAFIISLSPFAHPAAFHETLEAGQPIFIEKPVAMTAREAFEMMQSAERKNIPVHVGFMRRYYQKHIDARQFIAANDPGKIFGIYCRWFHAGETEMINCLKNDPDNFRLKVSQIPFHCCHALDNMLLYGGTAVKVTARGIKVVDRPYPSPDEVTAMIEFKNGVLGTFQYSSMAYKPEISYVLHTENYTLTFDSGLNIYRRPPRQTLRMDESRDCRAVYHKHIGPETRTYQGEAMPDHLILGDFLDAVRNKTPMRVTMRDAVAVAELAEAIESSWRESRPITLPLNQA